MPTTTNVTETSATAYTWDSAGFAWSGDARANKTWAAASYVTNQLDVGETIAAAEAVGKTIGLNESEAVAVAEKLSNRPTLNEAETLAVTDDYADQIAFNRGFAECVSVKSGGSTASTPQLDGSQAANVPHNALLNISQLTIEAWIQTPASMGQTWRGILGKFGADRDYNFYIVCNPYPYDEASTGGRVNALHFSSTRGWGSSSVGVGPLAPFSWHHVGVTVDAAGLTTYYLNGAPVGTYQGTPDTAGNAYSMNIGACENFWNGKLANVRLYSRACSAAEMAEHAAGRFHDNTGLVGFWPLNEAQGALIANDASGNGLHGTWNTAPTVTDDAPPANEISLRPTLNESESIGFTDSDKAKLQFTLNILRDLNIAESYIDNIDFIIRASESIGVGELLSNNPTLNESEAFGIIDGMTRSVSLGISELVAFVEALRFDVTVKQGEAIGIADSAAKQVTIAESEAFSIAETKFEKDIDLVINEALALAELFGRTATFNLALAESLSASDALAKSVNLSKKEAIKVFEEYRRRGNAVISDMIVQATEMDLAAFQKLVDVGRAPGFAPFKDFIGGDYDYRHALFRAIVESSNADRARLTGLSVQVDVPDVFDRGSATITPDKIATGVRVTFARPFHAVPEITMNVKGGTVVCIPKLVGAADTLGFTAVLVDLQGNNVAGSFTWAAHGY